MKKLIFLLLIVLSFMAVGCSNKSNGQSFEDDYKILKGKEHVFVKSTYQEVINALTTNQGVNVIFFAFDPNLYECPFCMAAVPILNEVAIEEKIEKILYLDIYEMRMNNTPEYQLLLGFLDSKVDDLISRDGTKKLIVPDLYVVKDGEILGHHIATVKNEEGQYIYDLTENEKNELKDIYRGLFRLI